LNEGARRFALAAARKSRDGGHARRLLALAAICDGAKRIEAAKIGGVTRQIVRDWVVRFNAQGPNGLIDRKAPGRTPRLTAAHRAALARMNEDGPIPAVHGVAPWRLVDLCQRTFEEFRVTISPQTMSREVRALAPGSSPIGAKIAVDCGNPAVIRASYERRITD
jgi:transposase